jgi:hypothetical protein
MPTFDLDVEYDLPVDWEDDVDPPEIPTIPPIVTVSTGRDWYVETGRVQTFRRIEIYESDRETLWLPSDSIGLIDGSVSVDISRNERRMMDLSIIPIDGSFTIGQGSLWYDKIIRPYWGFMYQGDLYEVPLGDFLIDTGLEADFPSTVVLTCRDLTKKMLTSKFGQTTTFRSGTFLEGIVTSVAANCGILDVTTPWGVDSTDGPSLTNDHTIEADTSRFEGLKDLLLMFGYELFFNAYGTLIVRTLPDPYTQGAVFTFETGDPRGTLVRIQKRSNDSELYNHIIVRGSESTNGTVYGEAEITDETSPVHSDFIGDRTWTYLSSQVADDDEAAELAQKFLNVAALESYELGLESIVVPWLEGGDVVGYIDPDPSVDIPENYLLTDFTIPLKLGTMPATGKRVVSAA